MIDPLRIIRDRCSTLSDSIRWACILEATAPKAGNVYPGRPFTDLTYSHFTQAAELASHHLSRFDQPIGCRIHDCIRATRSATGTNVNLGIVLLIAPLAEAAHSERSIDVVLSSLAEHDSQQILKAISNAGAGGLDRVDEMDVFTPTGNTDVVAAMRLAANRDRIARQYTEDFSDLHDNVVPVLSDAVGRCGDLLSGICDAHLQILATSPDSLIARKCGIQVANQVQQRAGMVNPSDLESRRQFDDWLRSDGNRMNPGTTADLIAAALFVLLTPQT